MYDIPTSIQVDGEEYTIRNRGDYRVILDCFAALEDSELNEQERLWACLIIFLEDCNDIEDVAQLDNIPEIVNQMYLFFNCGTESGVGKKVNHKLIDWDKDSQLICSAVNKVANKEIRLEPYIHWWTFMGYYTAIGESPLSTIISIRDKMLSGKKLEKYEKEFRRDNPQFFVWNSSTVAQTEADKLAKELWNSESV
ncbi:MAG: hypothetical protein IKN54_01135 [Lachnospiraceae bacterium]|nr:hypothetical protein [Lachnospiraceae bacterium]